ncbi:charged multivesicular body protein 7 isoform X2 [Eublepharis macularius]|uniref:Charged multivesicular body protein 7 isoform X2 n=1 Tax=Eublepharis macularius TaxID=481883 RepID=A0AA97LFV7_EUBMA|nr:charged multivesicular body protein 7 isoform X2 [Eublepharis macularius]
MSSPEEVRVAPLPEGDLPPEWETDEERMAFLFSAFKQSREVNATDWDSKMGFWSELVLKRGRRRGEVRTCLRELQQAFERRGSVPLGLGTVLRELLRRGKLQRESDFMASVDSSWISWGVGVFILKPLKWTLSSVLGDSKVPEEEEILIYVELLQEKAEEVYHLYQNSALSSHPVVGLSELRSLCTTLCPDERTFCLVLLQLQKEKRVTVLEQNGDKIMKFARGLHAKVSPVNDVDIGVYQLMQSEQLLSQKVESLAQEAERCKEEARSACRAGKKQLLCDTQDEVSQTLAGVGINGSEADTEELEKELHNLLLDSSKELPDLPSVPQKPLFPESVLMLPSISDAELEAELEKLTLSDGGLAQKTNSGSSQPERALELHL